MTDKRVLTVQDISCIGQCSLTVALPIISACGVETIVLPSAVLSSHTGGFKGYNFRDLTEDIPKIQKHWIDENLKFDCIYTGYLGSIKQIDYVADLMKTVLKEGAVKIVDPAMADNGRLYYGFNESFVEAMAVLCSKADIILPNITEASMLTKNEYISGIHTEEYILKLLKSLAEKGAKKVILKGICYEKDKFGIAIYDCLTENLEYHFTQRINKTSHGTGDCFAAAFTGALIQGKTLMESVKIAADFVSSSIHHTIDDESHWYGVKFERALPMLIKELNY